MNKIGAIIIDGHVQGLGIIRSLGSKGIPCIVVEHNRSIAHYSKYCKGYFRCPPYLSNDFINFLIDLSKEGYHDWILFPTNDHITFNLSRNKDLINKYFKSIVPDFCNYQNIYSKRKTLEMSLIASIPIPKTIYYDMMNKTSIDELGYPLLVKGIEGFSFVKSVNRKAFLVKNKYELDSVLDIIRDKGQDNNFMLQELIQNSDCDKVVSFTSFAINGEIQTYWIGEKVREHPLQFGTATCSKSSHHYELLTYCQSLLRILNYTGVSEVEFLRDKRDGFFKIIEINARTWLWVSLAKKCGIDYALYLYNYLSNIPNTYTDGYADNLFWVHFWPDLFFSFKALFLRKLSFKQWISVYKSKPEFAVFSFSDIKPFIMESILLPYIATTR